MATLLLGALGGALGGSIGGSFLGISAAVIGQGVGSLIGRQIDAALLGPSGTHTSREGPRLDSLEVMSSQEGAPIPEIAGRVAISGEVIWATKLKEVQRVERESVGSGKKKSSVTTTFYDYFCSFAISLGEGPISSFGRLWVDGNEVDFSDLILANQVRFYSGSETQEPDPVIAATEGHAPAFRGTSYIVFEDLPLNDFGNRIPQIKVEVFGSSGEMENLIKGVNLIPGSTEWGYMPEVVNKATRSSGSVVSEVAENAIRYKSISDWTAAVDLLGAVLPQAETASLVVSWFGTDLRAGQCRIEPRLDFAEKDTTPAWTAGGLSRDQAAIVSRTDDGNPSFGSAPADISVIRAIKDLKARGHKVVLYPFIMMDVTEAQALPDPTGAGSQGAYPWRGRIMPDAAKNATAEISDFMGTAAPSDFAISGESVSYSGPSDFRFRRFILHLASLAAAAGGVDAFLIGSEMRGLTMAPDVPGDYPFVTALKSLAADVATILPSAKISYAADWSEYHSHRTGGEVYFHLDPLWADPNIDFVGIDNYLPLSDWRAGTDHLDFDPESITSVYNLDYLKSNIEGGEYWDWFYASAADRETQTRTPIQDFAHGEDWVFRQKAIRDWHGAIHRNRPGGTREAPSTAWVPGSKPVWFTELGCPAIDLGSNQPNVFVAAFTSESSMPYFSGGVRDDFMQRQFLRASLEWWRDNGAGVLNIDDVQIWAWDARPWPEFPAQTSYFADSSAWTLGHWINGRAGAAPAAEAISRRLAKHHGLAVTDFDVSECHGQADGYPAPGPMGFRAFMQPLEVGLNLQSHEINGKLVFESRSSVKTGPLTREAVMVDGSERRPYTATRSAIEDVAGEAILTFRDGTDKYEITATRAVIGSGREDGLAEADIALVMDFERGTAAAERLLRSSSDAREKITFRLPRSATYIRPGILTPVVVGDEPARIMIVDRVTDGFDLQVEASEYSEGGFAATGGIFKPSAAISLRGSSAVLSRFLDLPLIAGFAADEWDGFFAHHAQPWPGAVVTKRSATAEGGFSGSVVAPLRSSMGETLSEIPKGIPFVWSSDTLDVKMYSGTLQGRPDLDVLSGANGLAIRHPGGWEIVQFRRATLIAANTYRLTGLLRGQRGTEGIPGASPLASGASVVVLDGAVIPASLTSDEVRRSLWYKTGPADRDEATHALRQHTFEGVGQRPFAPVHLSAATWTGDAVISWTRRTRLSVGTWLNDGSAPVLGEASEKYRIEIGPEGSPVRTLTSTTPQVTYTAAQIAADGISAPYLVRVAQVSETYGPGTWASLTISE